MMEIFKEFHRECESPNHCGRKITKRKKRKGERNEETKEGRKGNREGEEKDLHFCHPFPH